MRTPEEVLNEYKDLANYWRREIHRRHEMQMPRPHNPLEIRSILYGEVIVGLYYTLKQLKAKLAAHIENEGDECPLCVLEAEVEAVGSVMLELQQDCITLKKEILNWEMLYGKYPGGPALLIEEQDDETSE